MRAYLGFSHKLGRQWKSVFVGQALFLLQQNVERAEYHAVVEKFVNKLYIIGIWKKLLKTSKN